MRGVMVGAVVMAVSLFFTRIDIQYPLIMLSVLVLTAVVFALAGMVNAIYGQKIDDIAIIDHGEIIQNTDMKSLLATLDIETFVLDLREPVSECPCVDGMDIQLIDENTVEASLPKAKSLNNLFAELDQKGVHVLSMRNKANRLEELFLRLGEQGALKGEQGA